MMLLSCSYVYGLRFTVYGLRFMVYGLWCFYDNRDNEDNGLGATRTEQGWGRRDGEKNGAAVVCRPVRVDVLFGVL